MFDLNFIEHAQTKKCSTPEYMNLYFKVKGFYFKYVADLQQYKASIPEFSAYAFHFPINFTYSVFAYFKISSISVMNLCPFLVWEN